MSSKKHRPQPAAASRTEEKNSKVAVGHFSIQRPVLWLILAVVFVYARTIFFGYTELDDSIFVREFSTFNQDVGNLVHSFSRGLFDAVKDPYYRPLFSDSIILNYIASGDNLQGYHIVNIALHALAVVLLFRLFRSLGIKDLHSFLLSMVFAVHPVLSQAVAWVPGRNDTMLAVFVFAFLLKTLKYERDGRMADLALAALFLLLAFFTKETAVFAAPAAFVLLVLYRGVRPFASKKMFSMYGAWLACFAIWYFARAAATTQSTGIATAQAATDFFHRLPVVIQYLGKIILPFNLSVFPTQADTSMLPGFVALVLLVAAIVMSKPVQPRQLLPGLAVFFLFLMPALLVPQHLNQQTFEHRLYLPLVGILLLLPATVILNNRLGDRMQAYIFFGVCGLFVILNLNHQQYFADRLAFWGQAVETSPNSAYANMMLAARLGKDERVRSEELFRKAYRLNPKEKYLNFYMGEMLLNKDSVLAAEPYLLKEKELSDYVQCDFYLARVALVKGKKPEAIGYLERFVSRVKYHPMADNNLLLLYMEVGHIDEAREQARKLMQHGANVPPSIRQQLGV